VVDGERRSECDSRADATVTRVDHLKQRRHALAIARSSADARKRMSERAR
jgi:hypothetical protein